MSLLSKFTAVARKSWVTVATRKVMKLISKCTTFVLTVCHCYNLVLRTLLAASLRENVFVSLFRQEVWVGGFVEVAG